MHQHQPDLQFLQSVREQQEKQALRQYGQALKTLQEVTSQLDSLHQQLQEAKAFLESRYRTGCSAEEVSRLRAWCASLQSRHSAFELAAKSARNQARLTFTQLLATRHISAVLKRWQHHGLPQLRTLPPSPNTPAPASDFLRLFAQPGTTSLWN